MDTNVEQPKHPMHALTTFEIRDYRRPPRPVAEFLHQYRAEFL